jgi:hypothetical protein
VADDDAATDAAAAATPASESLPAVPATAVPYDDAWLSDDHVAPTHAASERGSTGVRRWPAVALVMNPAGEERRGMWRCRRDTARELCTAGAPAAAAAASAPSVSAAKDDHGRWGSSTACSTDENRSGGGGEAGAAAGAECSSV